MHSQQTGSNEPGVHRFWRRQQLIPLTLLMLLALPALQPLAGRGLTCGFDTAFHLWRAVEAGYLLREGLLFARWAPHMAHGYGYPLFLFQSPLSAYLAALINLLGIDWALAVNAVYGLGLLFSALTLWLLGRDLWGGRGGIVAAVAFLYAPFHAYVAFYRASLSETVAWALPPLILWGLRRWQQRQERRGLAAAVLGTAALMLAHDVTTYAFLPLFLGWIGAIALVERSWRVGGRGMLALGLGLGSSAFFWLPALLERGAIQFERANSAWPFQYSHNFLPLDQLLALPRNADPTLLNDWPPRALGVLLLAAALIGCLAGWRQGRERRWLTALLALALAGYVFLALGLSRPLWDAVPLLSAFQFPWRFLAPATLAAAMLAAAPFAGGLESKRSLAPAGWLAAIVVLSAGHWGWFYPDTCAVPDDISVAGMVAWEQASDTLGTTARRELLPVTVQRMPQEEGERPPWQARLAAAELPDGAQLLTSDYGLLGATIELETPQPFQARYRAFAFPGWRVTIDGEAAAITPSIPEGLISFEVPAGRHTIVVHFGETRLWLVADAISLVSLLLVGVMATSDGRRATVDTSFGDSGPSSVQAWRPATGDRKWAMVGLLVALALVVGKLGLVDRELTPLRQSRLGPDGRLDGLAQPLALAFGGAHPDSVVMRLLGHQTLPEALAADEALEVVLYWRPLALMKEDYRVGLTLVDGDGRRWSAADLRDSRWFGSPPPTDGWRPGEYALTALLVDPLPGTPPGAYTLQLSLFERHTLAPLTIYDEAGQSLGPAVSLRSIRLAEPRRPWSAEDVAMQYRLNASTPELTLWGSNVDRAEAAPGDPALVTLFWSSGRPDNVETTLDLVDERGQVASSWSLVWPAWGEGLWRSQELLRLPAALEDGRYTWQLELPGGKRVSWASLAVSAPERLLEAPAVAIPIDVTLGQQATLVGVTVAGESGGAVQPGETLRVDLVWRGEQEMAASYHVFVHLRGPAGALLAQSDAIPAGWQRPTTGWRPGEYVVDSHTLTIPAEAPAGEYRLEAGLYLPGDGRLAAADGSESVHLITFRIYAN